jgi:transcriptional regulator with XRE-family HTH domain
MANKTRSPRKRRYGLSLGAQKLGRHGTQKQIEERLGGAVTQQAISQWLTGQCRPNSERILEIQKAFGISPGDWFLPAKKGDGPHHRSSAA